MSITKAIKQQIDSDYSAGKTQKEIGEAHNVSQQYIQRLLSGERSYSQITAGTIDKMFPQAEINLTGAVINNSGTMNIASSNQSSADPTSREIIQEIIRSPDISAVDKAAIIKELTKK